MRRPEREQTDPVVEALFNNDFLGIAIIDSRTGEIRRANREYCCIMGRNQSEIVGSRWMDFATEGDRRLGLDILGKALDGHRKVTGQMKRCVKPDGSVCHVRFSVEPLPGKGDGSLCLAIAQDETELERVKEERRDSIIEFNHVQESFFPAMAVLSEFRDRETGEHLLRTRQYVRLILDNLPNGDPFSGKAKTLIANSAMLHDIGKVGIPDSILLKKGRLTREETATMQSHTILGGKTINRIRHLLMNETMFMFARDIAEHHHERWDGTGYPSRLRADEIPLTARIMTIADVYDALRSERPYKAPYSHGMAVEIIAAGSGSQFDPALTDVFLRLAPRFEIISKMERETLETGAAHES